MYAGIVFGVSYLSQRSFVMPFILALVVFAGTFGYEYISKISTEKARKRIENNKLD